MILDTIDSAGQYRILGDAFATAVDWLQATALGELTEGKHEIDGHNVYALVIKGAGRSREEAPLEIHKNYADKKKEKILLINFISKTERNKL